MSNTEAAIRELVTTKPVVLFMKGSRHFPQCGFSAQVIEILNQLVPSYETVNVLADAEMRDGIKKFSDWPTIPQLYVGGKFVGGCDIVKEMFANGELAEALGAAGVSAPTGGGAAAANGVSRSTSPTITLTDRAVAAIEAAREAPGDELRLAISPAFVNELYFDGPAAGDVVVKVGSLTVRLDASTASRAKDVRIDFVETPAGAGFKIENSAEPRRAPEVRSLTPKALRAALDAKESLFLFDVRTDEERRIAQVKDAIPMNEEGQRRLESLREKDVGTKVVFLCHHGMRSRVAAESALRQGFTNVWNLEGGIDAWSVEVDAGVPRY